ncbi:MAG: hypothetical protein J6V93_03865, partial [Clostridia bacterium]|nr:hypothetical protein [Clostridia bacterium]
QGKGISKGKTVKVFLLGTFFHPFGVYQKGVPRKGNKRLSETKTGTINTTKHGRKIPRVLYIIQVKRQI